MARGVHHLADNDSKSRGARQLIPPRFYRPGPRGPRFVLDPRDRPGAILAISNVETRTYRPAMPDGRRVVRPFRSLFRGESMPPIVPGSCTEVRLRPRFGT